MGIGPAVGSALLAIAVDLSFMVFGLLCLATLISGVIIISNIGGQGLQKPIRQYFMAMFFGTLLSGGFQAIARGLQNLMHIA